MAVSWRPIETAQQESDRAKRGTEAGAILGAHDRVRNIQSPGGYGIGADRTFSVPVEQVTMQHKRAA
jgi:hypothetical protein